LALKEALSFMLKRAILLFAFSVLIYGCAAKVSYEPPAVSPPSVPAPMPAPPVLFPDLVLTDIFLNEDGYVVISIANSGPGRVPCGLGKLALYVDKDLQWSVFLKDLPDQAFLEPGGRIVYTTPVKLVGRHEVGAFIDKDDEIAEENESNNLLAVPLGIEKSLPSPPAPLSSPVEPEKPDEALHPDIAIVDLSLNPRRKLVITLENRGDAPFPMKAGTLKVLVDGAFKESVSLTDLSEEPFLAPKRSLEWVSSLTILGRHKVEARIDTSQEIKEWDGENNGLRKTIEGIPIGPDLVITDLDLTEDLQLSIILSNAGDGELRKGVTLRVRVAVNDQKVSEFDHFISEALKTNFGSQHVVDPPYGVTINGSSRVKVSIWPKSASDDVRPGNNTLERYFIVYPFRIGPQTKQEFSISPLSRRAPEGNRNAVIRVEARWEGGILPLRLSVRGPREFKRVARISGKSPLKLEVAFESDPIQKGKSWTALVTNLTDKRAEGYLIVQHP
jgi:hypothetical protein